MARLFSYIIPVDDGAAPNPFGGICTLAICKPRIRSVAKPDDWVVGLGSKNAPRGNLNGRIVYAMKVKETPTMEEYDRRAQRDWPHRIPKRNSPDLSERLGDCIYDFAGHSPKQRPGVHGPENMETDLSGKSVLISRHFYYFGARAIQLPDDLLPIADLTRGHRSTKNEPYFDRFVSWLEGLNLKVGQLYGWPDFVVSWDDLQACGGCVARQRDGESDEEC